MKKEQLKQLMDVAAGRAPADVVIQNCRIVDVYSGSVEQGDIALWGEWIAGIGRYEEGHQVVDAQGQYAAPGLIDGHIHIESSYLTPQELGRLVVPHGTTTIVADAHEIANVCGLEGLRAMREAAEGTALDVCWMLPSCVPATPFEHAGAVLDGPTVRRALEQGGFLGLGEFMDFPGVIAAEENVLDKLAAAKQFGVSVDGHSPGVTGRELNAYITAGISTDHECATVEEMREKISRGMYVLMRQGSACHNLRTFLKGVTPQNSRRCLLCTDDCQPKTILESGHLDNHLRICVEEGLDPITALQMASLNAAECYRLRDRGAIAPGLRADLFLFDNLTDFHVSRVWIAGRETAADGQYLLPVGRGDFSAATRSFHLKDFSKEKLRLPLSSPRAHAIGILSGGVVTRKEVVEISRDDEGNFSYNPDRDVVKAAVVERHHGRGNVAVGLLKGYGLRQGAIALSIAHDSHNIIVVGTSDDDMAFAVNRLVEQDGGILLVQDGQVLDSLPLPIAGLMTDREGGWVEKKLTALHETAHSCLGVSREVEPIMTLCFMSLPVIPELKLTDMGLFDVEKFRFIPVEA